MKKSATRDHGITPPPFKRVGPNFRKGGVLFCSFFDSGKIPPGFYFVQKSRAKCRWVFILSKIFGRFAAGFLFCGIFYKEIPPKNPIFSKFSRALRARVFILSKNFPRASRGLLFCLFFPPGFRVGSYFVQFSFPKNPPGFLLKGGVFIPWSLVPKCQGN